MTLVLAASSRKCGFLIIDQRLTHSDGRYSTAPKWLWSEKHQLLYGSSAEQFPQIVGTIKNFQRLKGSDETLESHLTQAGGALWRFRAAHAHTLAVRRTTEGHYEFGSLYIKPGVQPEIDYPLDRTPVAVACTGSGFPILAQYWPEYESELVPLINDGKSREAAALALLRIRERVLPHCDTTVGEPLDGWVWDQTGFEPVE